MIIKIYPANPNERHVAQVVNCLADGGVVIYPTDSVYALVCSAHCPKAMERIMALKGKRDAELTLVCEDIGRVAEYVRIDTPAFKILKRNLPGPFTFILKPLSKLHDKALGKRKSIGVRIPANPIPLAIISALDAPLLSTSVKDDDAVVEYTTDPELIHERYGDLVDMVVDGGYGDNIPTTLVDMTDGEPVILRQGKGELI